MGEKIAWRRNALALLAGSAVCAIAGAAAMGFLFANVTVAVVVGLITIPVVAMANGATKLLDPEPKPEPAAADEPVPAWAVKLWFEERASK